MLDICRRSCYIKVTTGGRMRKFFCSVCVLVLFATRAYSEKPQYGLNVNGFPNGNSSTSQSLLLQTGVKWIRAEVYWRDIETTPHVYDFTQPDNIVRFAQENGLHILYILHKADKATSFL